MNSSRDHRGEKVPFSFDVCSSFRNAKKFTHTRDCFITSLDYDDTGRFLVTTAIDDVINLYDTVRGKHLKSISSKKYGCHLAKFTHKERQCVYASTKGDDTIRNLDMATGSYLCYYKGHQATVTSLEVNPRSDFFVSGALDNTVRLWDPRATNEQLKLLHVQGPTHLALDPSGQVLCVSSTRTRTASFYIMKTMTQFDRTITLPPHLMWNKVEFSNNNKYILFSATNGEHLILDAFTFLEVATLTGVDPIPVPPDSFPYTGTASFSPDGRYVFSGSGAGHVAVWSLNEDDYPDKKLPSRITPRRIFGDDRPKILAFNPRYMQFTTADTDVNMWIPPDPTLML